MATKRWIGGAANVYDVWTGSVGGTWVAADTVTVTIANKSVVGVVGSTVTVAQVCQLIANMFNGLASSLGSGESYSPTGNTQNVPEFAEYAAVATATTVVFTARTAGIPGTISVSKSSTSGTFTIANTVAGTGKNSFTNVDNWSDNAAPANGDTLIFDSGAVDCLYNLSTSLTTITLNVLEGYTGSIGLPEVHGSAAAFASAGSTYPEYRTKSLTLDGATSILIDNSRIRRCRVTTGTSAATVLVRNTGARFDGQTPVVLLAGAHASNVLDITRGDVGLAFYQGDAGTWPIVRMAFEVAKETDARLVVGAGATLTDVIKSGGTLLSSAEVPSLTHSPGCGPSTLLAGDTDELVLNGGVVNWNSPGTLGGTSIRVGFDGHLNFDQDARAKAIGSNIEIYGPNAKMSDTHNSVGSLIYELHEGAKPENVRLGPNTRHTIAVL